MRPETKENKSIKENVKRCFVFSSEMFKFSNRPLGIWPAVNDEICITNIVHMMMHIVSAIILLEYMPLHARRENSLKSSSVADDVIVNAG